MKNLQPEKFLDIQELSALENETVKGGSSESDVKVEKKKEKQPKEVEQDQIF